MKQRILMAGRSCKLMLLYVTLMFFSVSAFAQQITVTGKVTDEMGEGVPGATIMIKGTSTGTITDLDGKYTISVNGSSVVLVFSYVGYLDQEIEVGSQQVIDVQLVQSMEQLEEVIVVGYGQQKKETVVGSVTQAKGEELLKAGSVATVSEALSGILPGVSTMQASGQPGASAATILIRGQSTWANNSPLFLVDGVERDFNDLDPNEIESISVLKDASATAVFGVKGANGVILITTKRGVKGKTRISFSSNYGTKVPVMETDYLEDRATALEYYNIALRNEGKYKSLIPDETIEKWRDPNRDMDYYSYTNWVKELAQAGPVRSTNLNVSGGNDFVKYFTSVGYNYDGDVFGIEKQELYDPRVSQKRYNWRSNLDFNFTETTRLKINLSGDFKNWHGNRILDNSGSGVADPAGAFRRMFNAVQVGAPPVLSDGRLGAGNKGNDWMSLNFLGEMERQGEIERRSTRMYSDFIFEQEIFKDFLFKGMFSYNFNREYESRIDMDPLFWVTNPDSETIEPLSQDPDKTEGLPNITTETLQEWDNNLYYELSLNYNKTIAGSHNVSALALFHRKSKNWGDQFIAKFPTYEESWVGRLTYDYKLKYMLEFNGAYNGSENFAPNNKFGFFPSVAAGWAISEEGFFKNNIQFMDFMKLRGSYGIVGNDQIGGDRFPYLSDYLTRNAGTIGISGYGTPYAETTVLYGEGRPANILVEWENSEKANFGLDMTFFQSRLKTYIDLFDEKRTKLLMERRAMASWFGNQTPYANIGETKNHGIELEIIWNDRIGDAWSYFVKGNFSLSENRIILRDDASRTPEFQKEAGKPIGWISGNLVEGYLNSWDDVYNYTQPDAAKRIPGDISYVDYNADGILDNRDDVVPILEPSYAAKTFAFSLGLTYKQFSVSALFNGTVGISKYLSAGYLWEYQTDGGIPPFRILKTEMKDYWTPDNLDAGHPVLHSASNSYNDWTSTYTSRSADFLRLKNAEIKYTFSQNILAPLKIVEGLEIYANGNNLFTWTKLPDMFDPEAAKLEVYPITKRFMVGLRANF